ncbi:MAG TPA: prepilin-type N-terminal cleavage/methylation domain-containing protein [Candidatus Methylacidiphilales bacterium]|jgi:prepilin-type N-terminal cleavage/methylation domain-containing protein|nr:prepilin-type N-terminal cleavage/methylation domain-containing protein [Candidatus Methylacidiphilales bacterium]
MCPPADRRKSRERGAGFSLVELLVAVSVFALLLAFTSQLLLTASSLAKYDSKRIDTDTQARAVLDRLAIDLAQIVKRSDVSYYLKSSAFPQTGNDQMAFYSNVPGYSGAPASPLSLVAYRVNPTTMMVERLGIGLIWNGDTGSNAPIAFLPQTIQGLWPQATNSNSDPDYEVIGQDVFRFEYYYLLKGQLLDSGSQEAPTYSVTPWDTRIAGHTSVNGLCDVAAIGVVIAVIDPASRNLVSNSALSNLVGQMNDFAATMQPGQLQTQWNSAIVASNLPPAATSAMRVYSRLYYLSSASP